MSADGMTEIVVPHEGTWIEITEAGDLWAKDLVVPHEGTWIEINLDVEALARLVSFPTRERGLKCM